MALPYITDNVIVGNGEVVARPTQQGLCYILPGKGETYDRQEAVAHATQLDQLISRNLHKYNRRLFRR